MKDFGRREPRQERDVPLAIAPKRQVSVPQRALDIPGIGGAKTLLATLMYTCFFVTATVGLSFYLLVEDRDAYTAAPMKFFNRLLE